MRDEFVVNVDENDGYPTFNDADFSLFSEEVRYGQIFACNDSYPEYADKKFDFNMPSEYSDYTFYTFSDVNNGYPTFIYIEGIQSKSISDIYVGDNQAQMLYFNEKSVKAVYFREKAIYQYGFGKH